MLLNRFLDVYDVVEDPDTNNIDNADFANTDIPSPYDVPLPEKNLISEQEREKIKDWILQVHSYTSIPSSQPFSRNPWD